MMWSSKCWFFRRLVSSEDTGVDEAQVQSLLKKHKDVTDELKHYANVIQQLKQQVIIYHAQISSAL